jgi:iron(III) transport system substrate-binding protein
MRRFLFIICCGALLVSGFGVQVVYSATPLSWDLVLAKAKEEGKVIVVGPGTETIRRAMTKPFEDRYGIKVEYDGGRSSDQKNKILTQRSAGIYQADLWIAGFGSVEGINVRQVFESLEPAFILPDVKNAQTWLNGFLWHDPEERRFLAHSARLYGGVAVNPQNVKPEEVTSLKDLLKAKYKEKIISDDPTASGVGQAFFAYLYLRKDFGPGFIKRLLEEQGIVFSRNARQSADWVAKGHYLLWTAPGSREVVELRVKGVPLEHRCLEDSQWLSIGAGGVGLFNKAPHPNAAVIYLNWLLSKEGQLLYSKEGDTSSRRLDVPAQMDPACLVPQPGKDYLQTDGPEALEIRKPSGELMQLLKTIYKRN